MTDYDRTKYDTVHAPYIKNYVEETWGFEPEESAIVVEEIYTFIKNGRGFFCKNLANHLKGRINGKKDKITSNKVNPLIKKMEKEGLIEEYTRSSNAIRYRVKTDT